MKVTGYRIQHALKELEQARDLAHKQFTDNVMQFDSAQERVELPELFARYTTLEGKIAKLQVQQALYNLATKVEVMGGTMSLHEAVKLVGGAGRAEKMWRNVAQGEARSRYHSQETTRTKDVEYAKRAVSVADAVKHAKVATRMAASLRQAIQLGNAAEVDLEGLDSSLLES